MLVVTSNWAIADGSVAASPRAAVFRRLFADLRRAAVRSGFRHDGRYLPISRLVFVLAGDTFDGLLSERWLGPVRPWERRREAALRHHDVFRSAWRHARRPLAELARLARHGIAVPPAGRHGRPLPTAEVPVPVHVVMLTGDRDAALARLTSDSPGVRRGMGLGSAWEGAGVRIVHGEGGDPLSARGPGPTLLESLAVDLLARFGAALVARPTFGERGRRLVRVLADGQPLDMPLRLGAALAGMSGDAADATWIIDAWRRSVDRWAREARRWGCVEDDHGVVDALAAWMHSLQPNARTRPAIRRVVAALSTPLPLGGGHRLTVAGHPGPPSDGADGRVVGLGPPALRQDEVPACSGAAPGAVSCIEAVPAPFPAALPAVALFESGEGGGRSLERFDESRDGAAARAWPEVVPILDAA